MNIQKKITIGVLAAIATTMVLCLLGCNTTNKAGRILATTVQTVDAAMQGWAAYVATGAASPEDEVKVHRAYQYYQIAELGAEQAYIESTKNGNLDNWSRAASELRAAESALLAIIKSIQNTQ